MSEGLQKGNQLEISDPAKTKRDVFHRGCFTKSISKDLVSLQHRIKTSQPHKSHRSCCKTQIIPWPPLPASLQTAMGQSLGWEGGRKVRKCPAGWGFIGWVWADRGWTATNPNPNTTAGTKKSFGDMGTELKQELQTFSVFIYLFILTLCFLAFFGRVFCFVS